MTTVLSQHYSQDWEFNAQTGYVPNWSSAFLINQSQFIFGFCNASLLVKGKMSSLLASDRPSVFRAERAVHETVQDWIYGWGNVDRQSIKVINLPGKHWCSIVHVDLVDGHNRKPTTWEANKNSGQCFCHFHFLHVRGSLRVFCVWVASLWKHRPPHREIDTAIQARHDDKGRYYKR